MTLWIFTRKHKKNVPAKKNRNRSVICGIGIDGVIAYECRISAYNIESFIEFIAAKLIPYFLRNSNKIYIMDNASFH